MRSNGGGNELLYGSGIDGGCTRQTAIVATPDIRGATDTEEGVPYRDELGEGKMSEKINALKPLQDALANAGKDKKVYAFSCVVDGEEINIQACGDMLSMGTKAIYALGVAMQRHMVEQTCDCAWCADLEKDVQRLMLSMASYIEADGNVREGSVH